MKFIDMPLTYPLYTFEYNTVIYLLASIDKEALFNFAYNVTNNISSWAILQHNNSFNRYLPALQ